MVYILNLSMRDFLRSEHAFSVIPGLDEVVAKYGGGRIINLSVEFEEHYARQRNLGPEELELYHRANPSHKSAVGPIFGAMYRQMDMIAFYTASPQEAKVWYIPQGTTAPEAGERLDTAIGRWVHVHVIMSVVKLPD
jgi:ribosome-binding ATPase YchF (GTP1/OBG family)